MSENIRIDHEALKKEVEEIKKAKRKRERKEKIERTKEWFRENGVELAKVLVTGAVCATPVVLKVVGSINDVRTKRRLDKIERDKDYRLYDRSLGCYLSLKRKLRANDLTTIDRRRQNGERMVDILSDMNLLR